MKLSDFDFEERSMQNLLGYAGRLKKAYRVQDIKPVYTLSSQADVQAQVPVVRPDVATAKGLPATGSS